MATLSDTAIKALKPKDKAYIKSDGNGLQLLIKTDGTKLWEFRYTSPTTLKRRKTSFGTYPTVTLIKAREEALRACKMVYDGIDYIDLNKCSKQAKQKEQNTKDNTFKKIASEWLESYKNEVSENYHAKISRALELYTYSKIGNIPIGEVTRLDVISILSDLKTRNLKETARRTLQLVGKVFMYAVTMELAPHNITSDIDKKTVLGKKEITNYPTLTKEEDVKGLLHAIDNYKGDTVTQKAMQLLPYIFVRSFNLRHMEWSEVDFTKQEWTIPKEKMKMKHEFVLPLPKQAISILNKMKEFSSNEKYVFPSFRLNKPLSDNTFITALRRMGYTKEEMVPHSFRSIFSTISNENSHLHKYSFDVIEALLAHNEKNQVRGAYNRANYKDQMRGLIQWYADYLDKIKNS